MGIFDGFKSMFETKLNVDSRFEILREAISGTMSSFYMARDKKSDEKSRSEHENELLSSMYKLLVQTR